MTNYNTPTMGIYGSSWQSAGYCGAGNVEPLLGVLRGRPAIVCGNAEGVFDQKEQAARALDDPVIFAVNDVGMYLPRLDHWVSLHSDNLPAWKAVRWLHHKGAEDTKYHSYEGPVDYLWTGLTPVFALSGYFAMQIAHVMGAGLIVLCGCPGGRARRFFEASARTDFGYGDVNGDTADTNVRNQVVKEMDRVPELKEKVRSMSGWTKAFFGGFD